MPQHVVLLPNSRRMKKMKAKSPVLPEEAARIYERVDLEDLENQSPADWWNGMVDAYNVPDADKAFEALVNRGCRPAELYEHLQTIAHWDTERYPVRWLERDIGTLEGALTATDHLMSANIGIWLNSEYEALSKALRALLPALKKQLGRLQKGPRRLFGEALNGFLIYIAKSTPTFDAQSTATVLRIATNRRVTPAALKIRVSRLRATGRVRRLAPKRQPNPPAPRGRPRKLGFGQHEYRLKRRSSKRERG
jgi:hypothetical protein